MTRAVPPRDEMGAARGYSASEMQDNVIRVTANGLCPSVACPRLLAAQQMQRTTALAAGSMDCKAAAGGGRGAGVTGLAACDLWTVRFTKRANARYAIVYHYTKSNQYCKSNRRRTLRQCFCQL